MDVHRDDTVDKLADVVDRIENRRHERKRTRSPTSTLATTVLAGPEASAGTAVLSSVYLAWPVSCCY